MTAVQGVKFMDVLKAVRNLLQVTCQLDERHVRLWFGPSRPQLSGADLFVWFCPVNDMPDPSPGPQEYGNKVECQLEIHLATRSFVDEAQVDERRAELYYDAFWKIVMTFQNRNLFAKYTRPSATEAWVQPISDVVSPPLSVGSMLLKSLPVSEKTQREEGTIESAWQLTVPTVLALTVNDRADLRIQQTDVAVIAKL